MENTLSTVINDIIEALRPITALRFVGENWGQLAIEQPPVGFPCALVDIASVRYASNARLSQTAEGVVTVTVADVMLNPVSHGMPNGLRQHEQAIFELLQAINVVLHGRGSASFSPLMRESLQKVPQEDIVRQFVLSYRFAFTDSTATPPISVPSIPVAPEVTVG